MSRKSIQISLPIASPAPAPVPSPAPQTKGGGAVVDSWIAQTQEAAEAIEGQPFSPRSAPSEGATIQVRLSPQPDWFEATKIFFLLPQTALWFWTFNAAQRAMRAPQIWRR
ncbi:hypothetical protein [Rhodoblastus sp.]|jgi:hypothetical protein|uniref:hypothetical protein n=1 Tax=Rhodoblastus sp. TaxID=1962975 RepID=UPI0026119A93|nr:hypothetical protein [Rhodoblastus sp.]